MIQWIKTLFSEVETAVYADNTKLKDQEHQINNLESVSKKFLIVGLGNIGAEYINTRHNIGFKILDHLAKKETVSF